jgi:hypothetical protein
MSCGPRMHRAVGCKSLPNDRLKGGLFGRHKRWGVLCRGMLHPRCSKLLVSISISKTYQKRPTPRCSHAPARGRVSFLALTSHARLITGLDNQKVGRLFSASSQYRSLQLMSCGWRANGVKLDLAQGCSGWNEADGEADTGRPAHCGTPLQTGKPLGRNRQRSSGASATTMLASDHQALQQHFHNSGTVPSILSDSHCIP